MMIKKMQHLSCTHSICRLARAVMVLLAFAVPLVPDLDVDHSPTKLFVGTEDASGLLDRDFVATLVLTVSRDILDAPRSNVTDLSLLLVSSYNEWRTTQASVDPFERVATDVTKIVGYLDPNGFLYSRHRHHYRRQLQSDKEFNDGIDLLFELISNCKACPDDIFLTKDNAGGLAEGESAALDKILSILSSKLDALQSNLVVYNLIETVEEPCPEDLDFLETHAEFELNTPFVVDRTVLEEEFIRSYSRFSSQRYCDPAFHRIVNATLVKTGQSLEAMVQRRLQSSHLPSVPSAGTA